MATTETEGYVGRIVVTQTTKRTSDQTFRNGHAQERTVDRQSVELLDVTVRATTESALQNKLAQALELLESAAVEKSGE